MSALDTQIEGNHYKNVKIQPIELAYKLGASPAFCKLAKYLSRDKGDKKINLKKARHCIQLEKDLQGHNYYDSSMSLALTYEDHNHSYLIHIFSKQFTENSDFENALDNMLHCYYDLAVSCVEDYAKSLGIDLDE